VVGDGGERFPGGRKSKLEAGGKSGVGKEWFRGVPVIECLSGLVEPRESSDGRRGCDRGEVSGPVRGYLVSNVEVAVYDKLTLLSSLVYGMYQAGNWRQRWPGLGWLVHGN
jgi:hypothetical protein